MIRTSATLQLVTMLLVTGKGPRWNRELGFRRHATFTRKGTYTGSQKEDGEDPVF